MTTLKMGLIGCGWAGQQHAQALVSASDRVPLEVVMDTSASDRVRLEVVMDSSIEAARSLAEQYGVPHWTTDLEAVWAHQLDAVSICLPHHLHAEVTLKALERGCHVLKEKPLATSLDEADALIAAARAANKVLMVAENVLFDPVCGAAAALVNSGVIGEPFMIRVAREHHMHDYLRARPWFLTDPSAGIMMSGGVHDFELIRLLGGDFAYVFAAACPTALPDMRADDSSIALCELENGIAATVTESFSLHTPSPGVNGSVHGTRGGLWFQDGQIRLFAPVAGGDGDPVETLIRIPERNSFAVEVDHFLDCVLDGEACIASAERLRHTLASVLAAYESMRTNQRIEVAQFEAAGG